MSPVLRVPVPAFSQRFPAPEHLANSHSGLPHQSSPRPCEHTTPRHPRVPNLLRGRHPPFPQRDDESCAWIYSPFARGLGHARPRHFFLDPGARRCARFFLGFLLHRASTMTSRPKQYRSIQDVANNSGQAPQHPSRARGPRVPAKVIAQAEPGEMHRNRSAGIALSRGTKTLHSAIA